MKTLEQKAKHATYMREWRKNHPKYREKQKEAFEQFQQRNPNYFTEYNKQWRKTHPKQYLAQIKRWKKKHPMQHREAKRRYADKHREKVSCRREALKYSLDSKCNKCGATEDLQRHHPDHSKPEAFFTLCRLCHNEITKEGLK